MKKILIWLCSIASFNANAQMWHVDISQHYLNSMNKPSVMVLSNIDIEENKCWKGPTRDMGLSGSPGLVQFSQVCFLVKNNSLELSGEIFAQDYPLDLPSAARPGFLNKKDFDFKVPKENKEGFIDIIEDNFEIKAYKKK